MGQSKRLYEDIQNETLTENYYGNSNQLCEDQGTPGQADLRGGLVGRSGRGVLRGADPARNEDRGFGDRVDPVREQNQIEETRRWWRWWLGR